MSNKGKGGRGSVAVEKKKTSRSKKLELNFPVGRIGRMLKNGRYSKRVGATAPICVAAILEFLCVELLDNCAKIAVDEKRLRIVPRDMLTYVREDEYFAELFKGVTLSNAGVIPHIHSALLPKSSGKKSAESSQTY